MRYDESALLLHFPRMLIADRILPHGALYRPANDAICNSCCRGAAARFHTRIYVLLPVARLSWRLLFR